jgi:hypothetical protein
MTEYGRRSLASLAEIIRINALTYGSPPIIINGGVRAVSKVGFWTRRDGCLNSNTAHSATIHPIAMPIVLKRLLRRVGM